MAHITILLANMKTTLDLPDDLLIEAKTTAIRRRTTLKAIVVNALRRELRPVADAENPNPDRFEVNELGFLIIKKRPGNPPMTSDAIRTIQEEIDEEDARRALGPRMP
ncbi:hypothetical protein [Synoicihabitans lomoniglobus]|uniref:Antitoxin n=1 Tax=Synoicihabitans lomoniglobus TaxID=2909285 RepID=A0AAF0CP26_9BACT|nr:hypothetical protein [Opitutaceae bacterium LMO-M01]WED65300.1 hypothetical protein PXH66_00370 [Opitutaceae bacterium LMO-M01]